MQKLRDRQAVKQKAQTPPKNLKKMFLCWTFLLYSYRRGFHIFFGSILQSKRNVTMKLNDVDNSNASSGWLWDALYSILIPERNYPPTK